MMKIVNMRILSRQHYIIPSEAIMYQDIPHTAVSDKTKKSMALTCHQTPVQLPSQVAQQPHHPPPHHCDGRLVSL